MPRLCYCSFTLPTANQNSELELLLLACMVRDLVLRDLVLSVQDSERDTIIIRLGVYFGTIQ